MNDPLETIMTNPKVVTTILAGTSMQSVIDFTAPIIGFVTQIGSAVLVFMMIYFHYLKIKKTNEQRKIQDEVHTAIKEKAVEENKMSKLFTDIETETIKSKKNYDERV